MMSWDRRTFRIFFPHLAEEVMEDHYLPGILDHLERCKNEEEALELIDFFERTGEIDCNFAAILRSNLDQISLIFNSRKPGEYAKRGLTGKGNL